MRYVLPFVLCLAVAGTSLLGGCARAARDTAGFAKSGSATVEAGLEQTWQTVKTVLREQEYELYTRDKRGAFVAYTPMKRRFFQPKRVKYTVLLTESSSNATRIDIETINQVYGVTLLTYPDWHDRPARDNAGADAIIQAVQSKIAGAPVGVVVEDVPPAELTPVEPAVQAEEMPAVAPEQAAEADIQDEGKKKSWWRFWR